MSQRWKLEFWWRYLTDRTPWDTGVTPPEITALIEQEGLPPGRAIDLGCGTGTNVIYLAQHGWQTVGIDYVPTAIRRARRKARRAGCTDRVHFITASVTELESLDLSGPFDLAIDIGCGHSLPPDGRIVYARGLARLVRPGGLFMLYAHHPVSERRAGLAPEDARQMLEPDFHLVWSSEGEDQAARSHATWYRFRRRG